jgi:hypothetical protein
VVVGGGSEDVVIGNQHQLTGAGGCIVIGSRNVIPFSAGSIIAIGGGIVIAGGLGGLGALLLGNGSTTTAANNYSIAIGVNASAGENECVIGESDVTHTVGAIRTFVVRGLDTSVPGNAVIDTFKAIVNPAAGDTGVTLVYNAAGTYSNKTVRASASPVPVGSLLLYIDP